MVVLNISIGIIIPGRMGNKRVLYGDVVSHGGCPEIIQHFTILVLKSMATWGFVFFKEIFVIYKLTHMAVCQNLVPLVNIKIAGKWMFIPLKMVLIGIDPYPYPVVIYIT